MVRYISLALIAAASIAVSASSTKTQASPASSSKPQASPRQAPLPPVAACRHDAHEQPADRARRQAALALAKAINEAEGTSAERTRGYRPLNALRNLPPVPSGFDVRLYTDGAGYVVSLKDTLDPCRFGIFSDESGFLYEHTPQRAPIIATGS